MTKVKRQESYSRPVTRNDVARYAGVSTAVVSYVMNDGPKPVAAATAARVRRAIEVLGYRPNLSARALRSGSTRMLALVVSDITNPFFAEYALQVQAEAGSRGYAVLMANAHADPAVESQIIDDLIDRQTDGLILASVGVGPERARSIRQAGLSTVVIDAAVPVPGLASVGSDVAAGSRAVVEHLVAVHGHEQVALVIGQGVPGADLREQGWLAATRAAGLQDGPITRRPFTREGGYQGAVHLLATRNPPRAIFASSDLQAVGVLRAIHLSGLHVPQDVAVVAFDGTKESEFTSPPLTVARQPVREMARSAVSTVLSATPSESRQTFPMSLVIRESCGCPAADVPVPVWS
jgi:LacI family transcriptional regulator, galactose operon repressor